MSWIANTVPRQICQFLLNRYLGEILLEKVNIEQLSVDLVEGTGSINEVYLDVERINEALKKCDLPFELVEGFVGSITVKIPYSKVLNDSCNIEINGLELTCQPRPKYQSADLVASMIESVIGSMTTSVDLARSFVEENKNNDLDQKLQGIDTLAQLIQIILSRMKVNINKVIIRLENFEEIDSKAAAVEVRIDRIAYVDESVDVKTPFGYPVTEQPQASSANNVAPVLSSATSEFVKLFRFNGISFYTDIFSKPAESRPTSVFSDSKFYRNEVTTHPDSLQSDSLFKSTMSSHSVYHSLYMSSPSSSTDYNEFACSVTSNPHHSAYRNSDNCSQKHEDSPHRSSTSSEPVKFAECSSDSLLLRMKFKNRKSDDENLVGKSGVEIDFALGSINIFITPSQLKILTSIFYGLLYQESNKPDGSDKSAGGKPMADDDYLKVETELRRKMDENRNPSFTSRLNVSHLGGNWSQLDQYYRTTKMLSKAENEYKIDVEQDFISIPMSREAETEKDFSLNDIKFGSSRRSCKSQSGVSCTIPFTDENSNNNSCRIHWNNVCVILTHDDPMTSNQDLSPSKLIAGWASNFFKAGQKVDSLKVGNLAKLRSLFHSSYKDDHLQFLATPLEFQWTWDNATGTDFAFIAKKAEMLEYLYKAENHKLKLEPDIVEVLRFASSSKETEEESDIVISYCTKQNQGQRLQFDLKKCRIHVDLTIVDRLGNLLFHPGPFSSRTTAHKLSLKDKYLFDVPESSEYKDLVDNLMESFSEKVLQPNSCSLELYCPNLLLEFSFPIPLLSPSCCSNNRFAWQLRRVRDERLTLELQTVTLKSNLNDNSPTFGHITATFRTGRLSLINAEKPLQRQKILYTEGPQEKPCSIELIWDNANRCLLLNQASHDDSGDSNLTSLEKNCFKPSTTCDGPFHRKHVAHENEQLIMVGNRAEIREFRRECEKQVSLRLNIRLQTARLHLPTKSFYELLYNRLLYDLALWWPLYPVYKTYGEFINDGCSSASNNCEMNASELFELCKPYHKMDENPADDMDANFSVAVQDTASNKRFRSHQFAVLLQIASADAVLNIDENESSHKVRLVASNTEFFDVFGYGGDPNLSYVYLTSEYMTIKHSMENDRSQSNKNFEPDSTSFASGTNWVSIVDPTPDNLAVQIDSEDNFAVTVRINYDLKEDSRDVLLALGVRNSTVNYELNAVKSTDYWISQLINFFNVASYPLEGLQIPRTVNDIHAHAWNLAVQYNPEKLPYILRGNVGSADISTNIAQDAASFRFNIILENLCLFLIELTTNTTYNTRFYADRIIGCKLSLNDYVCVMKMGFFRIILTTNEATMTNDDDSEAESYDRTKPLQEIFLQNDILEIKTCVDSLSAFSSVLNELSRNLAAKNQSKTNLIDQIGQVETISDSSNREKILENEQRLASLVRSAMEDLHFAPEISTAIPANSSDSSSPKTKNRTSKKYIRGKAKKSHMRANIINEDQSVAPLSSFDSVVPSTSHSETLSDQKRNPSVKFLDIEDPDIIFVDNYLRFSEERGDFMNEQPADFPEPLLRYRISDFTVSCCLFGGRDFGICTDQKVYSNLAVANSTPKLRQKINDAKRCHFTKGGRNRDHTVAVELSLIRINCLHELYPPDWPQVSRQAIAIQDIQIKDHLAVSNINKLLYCYSSAERPRPSYTPMLCLKILQYMPENDEIGESECSVKLSLLPLRIHLDQDTLLFMFDFMKDYDTLSAAGQPLKRAGSSTHSLPIIGYPKLGNDSPQKLKIDCVRGTASYASFSASFSEQYRSPDDANICRTIEKESHLPNQPLTSVVKSADDKVEVCQKNDGEDQFFEFSDQLLSTSPLSTISSSNAAIYDNQNNKSRRRTTSLSSLASEAENRRISERQASNGVYFKNITFSPAVDVRLDYCGKHLQVEKQNVMEGILFGLGQLRSAQIRLKEVHNTMGVVGLNRLVSFLVNEWSVDIRRNQMYNIVGGLGPVHTFQQISQGIVDLFWMPVDQYRRDGHVVKGIQRGAHSFSVSTASAALELGQHLVGAVQSIAEFAFDVVNPSYPPKPNDILNQLVRPADFKDGVNMAYAAFYRGFHDTAQALTLATQEEVARGNWAIKGVLRQATPTLIRPIVVTSRAATHILGGLRSQLRPDTLQEEQNKWKDD